MVIAFTVVSRILEKSPVSRMIDWSLRDFAHVEGHSMQNLINYILYVFPQKFGATLN